MNLDLNEYMTKQEIIDHENININPNSLKETSRIKDSTRINVDIGNTFRAKLNKIKDIYNVKTDKEMIQRLINAGYEVAIEIK
jgi:hypothetical protein